MDRAPDAPILLVDDNAANLLALEAVLEPLGQPLYRAYSGEAMLARVAEQRFALIVLDVRMPVLDGFEAAALLRQRYPSRPIPLIFLSALEPTPEEIERGYAHRAVDFLVKPFRPAILRSKAAVFIELFLQREALQRHASRRAALERERELHAERAQLLEATRRAEQRFRALVEATSQIVWTTKPTGHLEFSPSWGAFTGQREEDWAQGDGPSAALHPHDRAHTVSAWQTAVATPIPFHLRYRLRRHDGEYRHVVSRAVPMLNEDGSIREWIGTIADIEDQKRVEAEIEANLMLREQLLAIVGHDLQNPLAAILFDSQKMLARAELNPTETRRAARIVSSAGRMARMITQLLDVSRARIGGGIPIDLQDASYSAICRTVIEELETAHPGRKIVYEESGPLQGKLDPDRLSEVVSNLVGNALQHGAGSTVSVRLFTRDGDAVLEVHNGGEPIPADVLPHLFDPFRRGKRETKSRSLGLGLYIAQQIVVAHGGALAVSSTSGDGTRFTATVPLREPSAEH